MKSENKKLYSIMIFMNLTNQKIEIMTTDNNGIFKIEYTDKDNPKIIFKPVNGTVWLTKPELTELFGVYLQTINTHIKAVYKSESFKYEDTAKYNLQVNRNNITYEATHFNLQIILALAFRINSQNTKLIRKWAMKQLMKGYYAVNYPISDQNKDFSLN